MWDTISDEWHARDRHLSHDLPCLSCGHPVHTFLACGDGCACPPVVMPGSHAA